MLSHCWHAGNSWSKWLRFFVYKTCHNISMKNPCTNRNWVTQILPQTTRQVASGNRISSHKILLECSRISCFFSQTLSLNEVQVKWVYVGFIACNQPVSQFEGNKLSTPSAKYHIHRTWQKVLCRVRVCEIFTFSLLPLNNRTTETKKNIIFCGNELYSNESNGMKWNGPHLFVCFFLCIMCDVCVWVVWVWLSGECALFLS